MHSAAEYRQYAHECKDSARIATSEAARTQFLELAQLLLAAAAQVELRANGKTTWSKGDGALFKSIGIGHEPIR